VEQKTVARLIKVYAVLCLFILSSILQYFSAASWFGYARLDKTYEIVAFIAYPVGFLLALELLSKLLALALGLIIGIAMVVIGMALFYRQRWALKGAWTLTMLQLIGLPLYMLLHRVWSNGGYLFDGDSLLGILSVGSMIVGCFGLFVLTRPLTKANLDKEFTWRRFAEAAGILIGVVGVIGLLTALSYNIVASLGTPHEVPSRCQFQQEFICRDYQAIFEASGPNSADIYFTVRSILDDEATSVAFSIKQEGSHHDPTGCYPQDAVIAPGNDVSFGCQQVLGKFARERKTKFIVNGTYTVAGDPQPKQLNGELLVALREVSESMPITAPRSPLS
jgi:hypothetical protein